MRVQGANRQTYPGSNAGRFERAEVVRSMRAKGWTIRALAEELGCSTYTIRMDLKPDRGVGYRRSRRRG